MGEDNIILFKINLKAWKQTDKQSLSANSCEKVESTEDMFEVPVAQTCGRVPSR